MNEGILIEELKARLDNRKVRAALFYSFNFDARFFENYILTQFIADVPFSDSAIQNAILWKKYQNELPPVTVYFDFHAKGNEAPSLDYEVIGVDLLKSGSRACFHPKHSYILLDDNSMIVIVGSNNLTTAGWCSNTEGVNVFHLKPEAIGAEHYYPYDFKWRFQNFARNVRTIAGRNSDLSLAEDLMEAFFRKAKYSKNENDISLYNSYEQSFHDFLNGLLTVKENGDSEKVLKVEVISPYYSPSFDFYEVFTNGVGCSDIIFSIPFDHTDSVAMEKELFDEISMRYAWGRCRFEESKGYRFNHSKIYHLQTDLKIITIVGSVNFTQAAFSGINKNGNFETAIAYFNSSEEWSDFIQPIADFRNFSFTHSKTEEGETDERRASYDLEFTVNWENKTLVLINKDPEQQKGKFFLGEDAYRLDAERTLRLTEEQVELLSENSCIRVECRSPKGELFYYPVQIGIEYKPLSAKFNLCDTELLDLWQEIDSAENKSSVGSILDRFIDRTRDESGDQKEEIRARKSTINLMSSHMSGLLNLKDKLFQEKRRKKDQDVQKERTAYYLLTENVDTVIGYMKLLDNMKQKAEINLGFYWTLLEILDHHFYGNTSLRNRLTTEQLERARAIRQSLQNKVKQVEKEMYDQNVDRKKLKWLKEQLVEA